TWRPEAGLEQRYLAADGGRAAQTIVLGDVAGDEIDLDRKRELLEEIASGDTNTKEQIARHLGEMAEALLVKNRPELERVAGALRVKGELTGDELKAIIKEK